MNKIKLTDKQKQHLLVLSGGERSAYPGLHMGTLNSLALKKCATPRRGPGSMFAPHNSIVWSITDAGRAALADSEGVK